MPRFFFYKQRNLEKGKLTFFSVFSSDLFSSGQNKLRKRLKAAKIFNTLIILFKLHTKINRHLQAMPNVFQKSKKTQKTREIIQVKFHVKKTHSMALAGEI